MELIFESLMQALVVQTNRSDRNRNTVGLTRVDEGLFEAEFRGSGREAFGEALQENRYLFDR